MSHHNRPLCLQITKTYILVGCRRRGRSLVSRHQPVPQDRKDGGANTATTTTTTTTTTIYIVSANSPKSFKPTSLHSATLSILLLVTLALLGLVEHAHRALPMINNDDSFIDTPETVTNFPISNIVSGVLADVILDFFSQNDSANATLDSVLRWASCTETSPSVNSSMSRARYSMKTIIAITHHVATSEMRIKARQTSALNPNACWIQIVPQKQQSCLQLAQRWFLNH